MKFRGKDYGPAMTRQVQYEEGKGLVLKPGSVIMKSLLIFVLMPSLQIKQLQKLLQN